MLPAPPPMKTRIVQSISYPGRWVVQGWFRDAQVWADIGDPCRTLVQAERKRSEFERQERETRDGSLRRER